MVNTCPFEEWPKLSAKEKNDLGLLLAVVVYFCWADDQKIQSVFKYLNTNWVLDYLHALKSSRMQDIFLQALTVQTFCVRIKSQGKQPQAFVFL